MNFEINEVYHIYNRGNNKQMIFFSDDNYLFFIKKMRNQIAPNCDILCWCLMPNHFHLIICANEESCKKRVAFVNKTMQELSYKIGMLLSTYTQAINKQNNTTGSLFQQKTHCKIIAPDSDQNKGGNYLINSMHYCHQNPWKAGFVTKIEDWPYSSFPDYCGFRNGTLCNKELLMELTGYNLKKFYSDSYNIIDGFNEGDFI